jgi:hypothetical protein
MATAAEVITSARFDLRDSSSTQYTDAELLDYLNRALVQLYASLGSVHSDWVYTEDTSKTLATGDNSVTTPTDIGAVLSLWIGSDEILKKDTPYIYYKRRYITATGQPYYFAHKDSTFIFERAADADYSLAIYYNKKRTVLGSGDTMPFDDDFNQPVRQAIVLIAKNRNEYDVAGDGALFDFFLDAAFTYVISRNRTPKRYKLGF